MRTSACAASTEREIGFFWPTREGMLFPAAVELQKRKAADDSTKRELRLTRWGLWIAAVSVAIQAILGIVELF